MRQADSRGARRTDGKRNDMEERIEFTRKSQEELRELEAELRRLQVKEKSARPDLLVGFWNQIFQLKRKRRAARRRVARLARDEPGDRDDLKEEVTRALTDLRTALETAETRFRP